ncbi:MAG: cytochrome c553 [Planctomycetota bacterium]|jgi:cytochrome c553
MKASHIGATLLALFWMMSTTAPAADIEAGKMKSVVCAACHGADGNSSSGAFPSLAGQHASYLVKQLKEFKSGVRKEATMQGMASILSDLDMENVGAYYASQKAKPVAFDGDLIEKGEAIYRGGIAEVSVASCMSCHAPSGMGNGPAGWPSLKGQHPEYIAAQLNKFKNNQRDNDAGRMMRNVAARMSDAEINAVSAYIAGIQ